MVFGLSGALISTARIFPSDGLENLNQCKTKKRPEGRFFIG